MSGIAITRTDLTAEELRAASSTAPSIPAARRMLALALVLEGADRTTAARSCGMDRQTLRDWVHRYKAEGLTGLADRKAPGRAAKLTPEQKQHLAALVLPTVDTTMMSLPLAEISKQVAEGAHAILVLDGAGYHGTTPRRADREAWSCQTPSRCCICRHRRRS